MTSFFCHFCPMITKKLKLTHKDIAYISKRWVKKRDQLVSMMVIKQYANKSHHQIWVAVSTKLHKSSVRRNMIKRVLYPLLYQEIEQIAWHHQYHGKFFFLVNSHNLQLKHIIHNSWPKDLKSDLKFYLQHHFKTHWFINMIQTCLESLRMQNFGSQGLSS